MLTKIAMMLFVDSQILKCKKIPASSKPQISVLTDRDFTFYYLLYLPLIIYLCPKYVRVL